MLAQTGGRVFSGADSIEEICSTIASVYHKPILDSCNTIRAYLQQHTAIAELPEPVSEIVQLIFQKIEDEMTHVFRKETGIVFPYIQQNKKGKGLQPKVVDAMLHTHEILIALLQKLRQVMRHYVTRPALPDTLKTCVNEMFLLETHVLQWIHFEQSALYPMLSKDTVNTTA